MTSSRTKPSELENRGRTGPRSAKRGNIVVFVTTVGALVAMLVFGAMAAGAAVDGKAAITAPAANARISGSVVITGTATAANFQFYKLEFGSGASPTQWSIIGDLHNTQVTNSTLGTWNVDALPPGPYMLKLTVVDNTGNFIESSVPVTVGATVVPAPQTPVGSDVCTQPARPAGSLVLVPLTARPAPTPPGSRPQRGIIRGKVLEASDSGVCGLVIKATRTGFERTTTTRDDGSYEIADLEPGTYTVVVEQQICTPAVGLNLQAGQTLEVDFVQLRAPSATVSPTGTVEPSPTAPATPTRTPTPLSPTPTASPTPTPLVPAAGQQDISRWWGWLGIDIDLDLGELASHFYLGLMGGFVIFVVGVLIALVRR